MKRLALLTIMTVASLAATAKNTYTDANGIVWTYYVANGNAWIGNDASSAIPKTTSGAITIPSKIPSTLGAYPVVGISAFAFSGCRNLTSITIPSSVKSIGREAFYGCSGLTNVAIGSGVTSIDTYAFSGCSGLTRVTIPTSVTAIGSYAFKGCSSLTSVTIPGNVTSIGSSLFSGCSGLTSVTIYNGVTTLASGMFEDCSGLTSVVIPNSVTSIGSSAFKGCSGLTSVTIPNSITSIGPSSFYGCGCLASVTIPDSVKSIGASAFYGCSGLTSVTIPNSVTSIGSSAFEGCSGLTSVTIPDGVRSIGDRAFCGCRGLSENGFIVLKGVLYQYTGDGGAVIVPDNVVNIGSYAFSGCVGLTGVTIPNGVVSIGASAFKGCKGLTSLTMSNSVTGIGDGAFEKCSGLRSITISNGITSIGDGMFEGCSALTSITIPNSVTSIGASAFSGCSGLIRVTIPNKVTNIEQSAFYGCSSLTNVTIGDGVRSIGSFAFSGCSGLTSVVIPYGVDYIQSFTFNNCNSLKSVVMPNSVTSIGPSAFSSCSGLTSVTIPNSVTDIGQSAFKGCIGLASVTIGDGVTSIGDSAFYGCSGLISATLPNKVTNIGQSAFMDCSRLKSIEIPNSVTSIGSTTFSGCSGLTSVTIPNGVKSIGSSAFSRCSGLTIITMPNSVTSIGADAFHSCSGLASVTIPSSVTSIGGNAFYGCSSLSSIIVSDGNKNYSSVNGLLLSKDGKMLIKGVNGDVVIPNGVTKISDSAFAHCVGLWSVIVPDSVTSIGDYAFEDCSGLANIEIGSEVLSIGGAAFRDCTSLTRIVFFGNAPTVKYNTFYFDSSECKVLVQSDTTGWGVNIPGVWNGLQIEYYGDHECNHNDGTSIANAIEPSCEESGYSGDTVCANCGVVLETGATIPALGHVESEGVVTKAPTETEEGIMTYYCSRCDKVLRTEPIARLLPSPDWTIDANGVLVGVNLKGLTDVVIPNNVTSIGPSVFSGCIGLTSVSIPDRVMNIGSDAFFGCSGLISVTIGNSVTNIGDCAFYNCSGLTSVTIPDSVTSIGLGAFADCRGLTSVTIPDGVTYIGPGAFYGCGGLAMNGLIVLHGILWQYVGEGGVVIIPDNVTNIGDEAFRGCSGLNVVTMPNSVTNIGNSAFSGCRGLTSVTIPDSVTSIGRSAFYDCSGLTNIEIGSGVSSIGSSAFSDCTSLTNIVFFGNAPAVNDSSFYLVSSECKVLVQSDTTGWGVDIPGVWKGLRIEYYGDHECNHTEGTSIVNAIEPSCEESWYSGDTVCANCGVVLETGVTIPALGHVEGEGVVTKAPTETEEGIMTYYCSRCDKVLRTEPIARLLPSPDWTIDANGVLVGVNLKGLTDVVIPNNVTSIGPSVFSGCIGLTSVSIPDRVMNIGSDAFFGCSGLISVTIGNSVTNIGDCAFYNCSGLTSVTIPDSVTSIGLGAFADCRGLTSVTIPDGVTYIGPGAFYGCGGLAMNGLIVLHGILWQYVGEGGVVIIPDNVTNIGDEAFRGCSGLNVVTMPNSVTNIGNSAFSGCRGLTSVTIPDSVTSIGRSAFYDCSGLTNIEIGSGVSSIGSSAFSDCTSLTNIVFFGNAPAVNDSSFYLVSSECKVLVQSDTTGWGVDIPGVWKGLRIEYYGDHECNHTEGTSIVNAIEPSCEESWYSGDTVCANCGVVLETGVTIPALGHVEGEGVVTKAPTETEEGVMTYYCSRCNKILRTESIARLLLSPDWTINSKGVLVGVDCKGLTDVVIPNNVRSIGDRAFYGCSGLTSVTIPDSVTSIGSYAFYGCSGLTGVTIPDSVTSINEGAFSYCSGLTSITIPDSVASIGYFAFQGCSALTSLTIGNGVASIRNYAFSTCTNLTSVTIPQYVCSGRLSKIFPLSYQSITNVVISDAVTNIGPYAFDNCSSLVDVTIGNGVTNIGEHAFSWCSALTSVTIPSSVTSIGEWVFIGCDGLTSVHITDLDKWCGISFGSFHANPLYYAHDLYLNDVLITDLTIPNSVTSIGDFAFYVCNGLTSVTIPNSVTNIGEYAFSYCSALTSVTIPSSVTSISRGAFSRCSGLTGVTILDGVTNIESYAFYGDSELTRVTIPDSVASIGDSAFQDCKSLQHVSVPVWLRGQIDEVSVFSGCPATLEIVYEETIGLYFDAPELYFTEGEACDWSCDNAISHDGHGSVCVKGLGDNSKSSIVLTLPSSGRLSFWWKASSESYGDDVFDYAYLSVDGVDKGMRTVSNEEYRLSGCAIGGSADWKQIVVDIEGVGPHTVRWTYVKDEIDDGDVGEDCVWLDELVFVPLVSARFDLGGGVGTVPPMVKELRGTIIELPGREGIECEDHVFDGWSDGVSLYAAGAEYMIPSEDVALTAQWTKKTFLAFDLGGGVGMVPPMVKELRGTIIELPGREGIECEDHVFDGWSDGVTLYVAGAEYTMPDEDVTLTAQWTKKTFLAFDIGGGMGAVPPMVKELRGSIIELPGQDGIEWEDHVFNGWSDGVTLYAAGAEYTVPDEDVTLTAQWTKKTFLAFDLGGGEGTVPSMVKELRGTVFELPGQEGFEWEDHVFDGWSDGVNTYVAGAEYTMPDEDITLTAQWIAKRIVTFVLDGGDGEVPATVKDIPDSVITLPSAEGFVKARHRFVGWSDGTKVYEAGAEYVVSDSNVEFSVVWEAKTLSAPTISSTDVENGGTHEAAYALISMTAEAGASIYYTVDGAEPTTNGMLYVAPIMAFGMTERIQAIAVRDDYFDSAISEFAFSRKPYSAEECLNVTGLTVSTGGGDTAWSRVLGMAAHDGVAAMRSGAIGDSESSSIEMTVVGAGEIGFWWKSSSEISRNRKFDYVSFLIDGDEQSWMGGEIDWTNEVFAVTGSGVHTFKWVYQKNDNGLTKGEDCAWLDGVTWTPTDPIPAVATDAAPEAVTNAIESAGFADEGVKEAIGGSAVEYNAFRAWADGVKGTAGDALAGEAAVVANEHAAAAYLLGAERLFENEPTVEIAEVAIGERSSGTLAPTMTVAVTVKDGESAVAVNAAKVAAMFEATGDLGDWNGAAKLMPTVTTSGTDASGKMTFTVIPGDGTAAKAFLRIRR